MSFWLEHKNCVCDLAVRERHGAVEFEGWMYCKFCRGRREEIEGYSGPAPALRGVPESRVTTLPSIPGFRIVELLGVITNLSSNSGWTASQKGNTALTQGLAGLRADAAHRGANGLVGLTGGPFGAGGGITSAFGGDAVGILLMGTAVRVELEEISTTSVAARLQATATAVSRDRSLAEDTSPTSLARLRFAVEEILVEMQTREDLQTVLRAQNEA